MMQRYCGNYWSLRTGLIPTGDALKILFEMNVPVRYRHVWSHFLTQNAIVGEWMDAETIVDLSSTGEKPDVPDSWKYTYRMEISYEIPDEIYPIVLARIAEKNSEYEEHWNEVARRPVPEWALGTTECEQGYMYGNEIAPEREFFDSNLYDIHGELRGIV